MDTVNNLTARQRETLGRVIESIAQAYETHAADYWTIEMAPLKVTSTGRLQTSVTTRIKPEYARTALAASITWYNIWIGKRGAVSTQCSRNRNKRKNSKYYFKPATPNPYLVFVL